jgi:MOSC domain-containing protein YiiM
MIRPTANGPTARLDKARVEAGRGVEGDRYWAGTGSFYKPGKDGQDLTLIEAEALEALSGAGIELHPDETGRNVLTRGIDLNALVGRSFRVGEVECVGRRLCDPCAILQRRTRPGVLRGLAGRGGLRADVVAGGVIGVGDWIVVHA